MGSWSLKTELTRIGTRLTHPVAFAIVAVYGLGWYVFEPETFNWHAAATMATWFMTLFIQRAAHRDTQAIHAKLDELLTAAVGARSELAHIDSAEPEVIALHRNEVRSGLADKLPGRSPPRA